MIHKVFFSRGRRVHGWDLHNVSTACRAIIKQAQPVDRLAAQRSPDLCESCDATHIPYGQSALYVKEAQESNPSAQLAA